MDCFTPKSWENQKRCADMKPLNSLKTVITLVPLAVLCILYGLWLVLEPPVYLESVLYGTLVLGLFCALYIRFIPACAAQLEQRSRSEEDTLPFRTHSVGGRELLRLLVILIAARAMLFILVYLLHLQLNGFTGTFFDVQRIWADHPDSPRYISIVNKGYFAETDGLYLNLAFEPLYSFVIHLLNPVYTSSIRAGFFLANINAVLSGLFLYELVLHDRDRRSARRAVRYFCLLPPTFLLSCVLPDSTFMLFSILCVYCARKKHIALASLFGALATLTRMEGLALLAPVFIEFFSQAAPPAREGDPVWKTACRRWCPGLWILLIPAAFMVYMGINYYVAGNPFAFTRCLYEAYGQKYALFCQAGGSLWDNLITAYLHYDYPALLAQWIPGAATLVLSLICMLQGQRRLPASYVGYYIAYVLMSVSATSLPSLPRQLFLCFPGVLAFVTLTRRRWLDWLLLLLCFIGLIGYLGMYVAGWPVQ